MRYKIKEKESSRGNNVSKQPINTVRYGDQMPHNFQKSLCPKAIIFRFLTDGDFPIKDPEDFCLLIITDDDGGSLGLLIITDDDGDDDASNDNRGEISSEGERKRQRRCR